MDKSLELVHTVAAHRTNGSLTGAYAYAFGMLSAEFTEEELQAMIDSIENRG